MIMMVGLRLIAKNRPRWLLADVRVLPECKQFPNGAIAAMFPYKGKWGGLRVTPQDYLVEVDDAILR
jgi:hypothetical protein